MARDDAADLLLELEQDRRLPILNLLPATKQRKLKAVLGHNPSTAGGIMNPDFIVIGAGASAGEALDRVRISDLSDQQLSIVCVTDDAGALAGTLSLAGLIRA